MLPNYALLLRPIAFKDVPIVGPTSNLEVLNRVSPPARKRLDMVELYSTDLPTLATIGTNVRTSPLISHKHCIPHLDWNVSTTILSRYTHRGGESSLTSTLLSLEW